MHTHRAVKHFGWAASLIALAALACGAPISPGGPSTVTKAATALPTTAASPTPEIAIPMARRALIQAKTFDLQIVDANGQVTPFANLNFKLEAGDYQWAGMAGDRVYAIIDREIDLQPQVSLIDASGMQPLTLIPHTMGGLTVWPGSESQAGRIAWGDADFQQSPVTSRLTIADVTAATGTTAYQTTSDEGVFVAPFRWTPDGQRVYFSLEPAGGGGYVLFSGRSSLYSLDLASSQVTEVVAMDMQHTAICLDDLSPDFAMLADHCDKQINVTDLQTGQKTTINPPAEVLLGEHGQRGDARFSPDGCRLAFAMARGSIAGEQVWIAVTDDLSGASRLAATSPEGFVYRLLGWLDNDHLLLAARDTRSRKDSLRTDSIQVLALDGSQPREVAAESTFVTFVP